MLVGARFLLTPQWGIYGEYKYNHAKFKDDAPSALGRITGSGDYDAHLLVAGVSYHFTP